MNEIPQILPGGEKPATPGQGEPAGNKPSSQTGGTPETKPPAEATPSPKGTPEGVPSPGKPQGGTPEVKPQSETPAGETKPTTERAPTTGIEPYKPGGVDTKPVPATTYGRLKAYFSQVLSGLGGRFRNVREWLLSLSPRKRWAVILGAAAALGLTGRTILAYLRDEEEVPASSLPRIDDDKNEPYGEPDYRTPNIYDEPEIIDERPPRGVSYYYEYEQEYDRRAGRPIIVCCEHCGHKDRRQDITDYIYVGDASINLEVLVRPKLTPRETRRSSELF